MKPLVYYARWQSASIRLRGRDQTAVWGHLVFTDDANQEILQPFHFTLATAQLTLGPKGTEAIPTPDPNNALTLDDMGVVIQENDQ